MPMPCHDFEFKPSRQYCFLSFGLLVSTLVLILFLTIDFYLKLILFLAALSYGGILFHRYALLRSRHAVLRITRQGEGKWLLHTREAFLQGELKGDSVLTSQAAILRFRVYGKYFPVSCLVFRDSCYPGQYRRLLVTLHSDKP